MKLWLIGALTVAMLTAGLPSVSEAKRLGGGKSTGMQRDMPARTAPDAPAGKPATPQAAPGQQAAPAAGAGAAAAAPKRNWMGPLAGLAAGLGIMALMSHLGLGEAFGNFLMMALLAVAAIALVAFLMRRFGNKNRAPALAGAGVGAGASGATQVAWPSAQPAQSTTTERSMLDAEPVSSASSMPSASGPELAQNLSTTGDHIAAAAAVVPKAFVPASFDSENFTRTAKMIFIRLQAANDTADLDDLRRFTTPELFASLRLDLQDRGNAAQQTDVQKVDAQVLDVANQDDQQVVSVRFTGEMVEEKGAAAQSFNEIWHLVKPLDDSRPWAIAGIEQMSH